MTPEQRKRLADIRNQLIVIANLCRSVKRSDTEDEIRTSACEIMDMLYDDEMGSPDVE